MNCQSLFSGENKKNIISLSSDEFTQRVVKVKAKLVVLFFLDDSFPGTVTVLCRNGRCYVTYAW